MKIRFWCDVPDPVWPEVWYLHLRTLLLTKEPEKASEPEEVKG